MSGRVEFTNHLIPGSTIQGADPLISGASGRFWASPNGRLRIELQADPSGREATGDVQILVDHRRVTLFDSAAGTAFQGLLPPHKNDNAGTGAGAKQPPSQEQIQRTIGRLMKRVDLSGAVPSDVAGQPAYTVRVSPKGAGGLLGGAELAWDAVRGIPLRAAVYARGNDSPVLELRVIDISFGAVPESVFAITPPPGTTITRLSPYRNGSRPGAQQSSVTGLPAVQRQTPFAVVAPQTLAGRDRGEVRLLSAGRHLGALVTYGRGLDGIAVVELPVDSNHAGGLSDRAGRINLPSVSINGGTGQELDTALGTVVRFRRGGVQYVVAGSVPRAAALASARGL